MENKEITLGNLFSGSGTWELAAEICGITPVFEAEIEPFPVALEAKRFQNALQLGDVSKINGAEIPPVDIFTNSSPCQDLSVAGKCARLQGFPDDWCADVPHSDSAEYKLWGNGIALPCLLPMMKAMKEKLQEEM